MKNLFRIAAAVSFAALAACGGGATDDAIAKMGAIADELCACTNQECVDAAMKKMASIPEPKDKPSKAQTEKAMKIARRMADCQQRITTAAAPAAPAAPPSEPTPPAAPPPAAPPPSEAPAAPAPTAAAASTGVPECDAYLAAFDKLSKCDKAGPALDGLRQGLEATRQGWAAWKDMPADQLEASKKAAAPGCKAGEDALRSTASSLGCEI
jgi:hypothetical protein